MEKFLKMLQALVCAQMVLGFLPNKVDGPRSVQDMAGMAGCLKSLMFFQICHSDRNIQSYTSDTDRKRMMKKQSRM